MADTWMRGIDMSDCITAERRCTKCEATKPESEFNWSDRAAGKRQSMCRACFSDYNRARYEANREQIKSAVKAYKAANPVAALNTRIATCHKRPTRTNAYRVVEAAIAAGVIARPTICYGCGSPASEHRIHAHHHDYNKPLDILWLCVPCHSAVHRAMRLRGITPPRACA